MSHTLYKPKQLTMPRYGTVAREVKTKDRKREFLLYTTARDTLRSRYLVRTLLLDFSAVPYGCQELRVLIQTAILHNALSNERDLSRSLHLNAAADVFYWLLPF
jgi:hypothetical protein